MTDVPDVSAPTTRAPARSGGRRVCAHGSVGLALAGIVIGATAGWRRFVPNRTRPVSRPR